MQRTKTPTAQTDRERIIELFAKRKQRYSRAEVFRLTRYSEESLATAIADGDVTPHDGGFRWEDVAHLMLQRWTPRMIDAALGHQRVGVIPALNRVQYIEAWLPLYQIRLLHYLAEQERGTVRGRLNASDILERQLLDLVSSVNLDEVEEAIPGFCDALRYPYFMTREDDNTTAFCRFCGRVSGVAGRELCDECSNRHQPKAHLGEHGIPELETPHGDPDE